MHFKLDLRENWEIWLSQFKKYPNNEQTISDKY